AANKKHFVSDMADYSYRSTVDVFETPELTLFCSDPICDRPQIFTCTDTKEISIGVRDTVLHYQCRNCQKTTKAFALRVVSHSRGEKAGHLMKMGEEPAFGPPLPARLQRLVQPDRELLKKGYQAEIHGQGIGAFAYYRRVVEDGKDRLIDGIIKVCK